MYERAKYSDGKLVGDPKPCAGNIGTQITVEDLFYNSLIRKKALKNPADEYNRVLKVVQRYAIHNANVSFSCKKQGSTSCDLQTKQGSSSLDIIRLVFGNNIARELMPFETESVRWEFKASGQLSNANFNTKKFQLILFINHRLVENDNIKKSIEMLYSKYLPKSTHPFVYLSLQVKPEHIDVNVHPTKKMVQFLHEDEIIQTICEGMDKVLASANASRVFYVQTSLKTGSPIIPETPQAAIPGSGKRNDNKLVRTDSKVRSLDAFLKPYKMMDSLSSTQTTISASPSSCSTFSSIKKLRFGPESITSSQSTGRNDLKLKALSQGIPESVERQIQLKATEREPPSSSDSFSSAPIEQFTNSDNAVIQTALEIDLTEQIRQQIIEVDHALTQETPNSERVRKFVEVRLTSVLELRQAIVENEHKGVTETIREHTFVGCVNDYLALIQHHTKLYLVDFQELSREYFYQVLLRGFSNFGAIHLNPPISIYDAMMVALESGVSWESTEFSKEELAQVLVETLLQKRHMLLEYFSIEIDDQGNLCSLPVLLREYIPNMCVLPDLLLDFANDVDWENEKPCFQTLCEALSKFYAFEAPVEMVPDNTDGVDAETDEAPGTAEYLKLYSDEQLAYRRSVEFLLFPALKRHFVGSKEIMSKNVLQQVADLPELYKIFERC